MTEKFNPWERFENRLLPFQKGDEGEGISNRRINPHAFFNPHWKGPQPAHHKVSIFGFNGERLVLQSLREHFLRENNTEKLAKVNEAIHNFKTVAIDWDDFV